MHTHFTTERKSSSSRGDMKPAGQTIGEINQRNLAERRHKKGECPTCGNKTHKIGMFGKRTPLTVEGLSVFGRCLLCHPVEGYSRRPGDHVATSNASVGQGPSLSNPPAPPNIDPPIVQMEPMVPYGIHNLPANFVIETENREYVDTSDDQTMVSNITMDHRLIVGARNWSGRIDGEFNEEDDEMDDGSWGAGGLGRPEPEPSLGDVQPSKRRTAQSSIRIDETSSVQSGLTGLQKTRSFVPPPRYNNNIDAIMDQVGVDIQSSLDNRSRRKSAASARQLEESFSPATLLTARPRAASPSNNSSRCGNSSREDLRKSSNSVDLDFFHQSPTEGLSEEKAEIDASTRDWEPPGEFAKNENAISPMRNSNARRRRGESEDLDRSVPTESFISHLDRSQQFNRSQAQGEMNPPIPTLEIDRSRTALSGTASRLGGSVWTGNKGSLASSGISTRSRRGLPDEEFTDGLGRGGRRQANVRPPVDIPDESINTSVSIDDISEIINSLDHTNHVRSFQSLAELITSHGDIAKKKLAKDRHIQILVDSMWSDMTDPSVMEAACELLFAITASSDGRSESDMLTGDSAETAVDFLLITMQTHSRVESIQSSGCGTLHCLASASNSNSEVSDGTLSGAVFTVVNAMVSHQHSQGIQAWGIRALYSQCLLSKHADANRKNLAQSENENRGGLDVIRCAMVTAKSDLVTLELACRLYWILAGNEDVARELMSSPGAISAIMDALDRYHKRPEAAPLMEAAFGALTNFARVGENQHLFRESNIIPRATLSIQSFHSDEVLFTEACSLLGVLATDPGNVEKLVAHDVVTVIAKLLLQQYDHNHTLQEEILCALVCVTNGCEAAKQCLSNDNNIFGIVVRLMRDRNSTPLMKGMACTLMGSLCSLKESAKFAVKQGGIDTVLALLKEFADDRSIHEAAFLTLRNITSQDTGVDLFLQYEVARLILTTMEASHDSVTAQLNACCLLWNIAAKAKRDPSTLVDAGAIMRIVEAMQFHMESGEVLEMACGALWCLIDQSETRKKELMGCGAIDAVTCTIVMHPNEPSTLEKACGLLANVCASTHMAEAVADSQGISIVVEAMAGNAGSMKLLELGTLVLRNMVLTNHEFSREALNAIPVMIKCMMENPDAVGFQREACFTLWALAAQSEECKNKIINLDGVTVLMGTLEHNSCVGDVQDAARGAINQLGQSSLVE